tara:strand:+ start:276 stop:614 length:339 start_codon:yes stop_codon:yes gene_type:complete
MSDTPPQISEDTELTLNLKTIGIIIGFTVVLAAGYFNLQSEIEHAAAHPQPSITKFEFDISQEAIKQIVRETQEHIRDGHTTMFMQLTTEFEDAIEKSENRLMSEIKDIEKK